MASGYAQRQRIAFVLTGLSLLVSGSILYFAVRPATTVLHQLAGSPVIPGVVPHAAGYGSWAGWFPSFIFVASFSLISAGILNLASRARHAIPLAWFALAAAFELGQRYRPSTAGLLPHAWSAALDRHFARGTFDPADIAAALAAAFAVTVALRLARRDAPPAGGVRFAVLARTMAAAGLSVAGLVCILATSPQDEYRCEYDPVYMSYDTLRQPIVGTGSVPLGVIGKIYVYGQYILVNSPNRGVHVIDNANPSAPINRAFIPILGNFDIAVKDGILYADSYVDLVAIDIRELNAIRQVRRVESAFPYNAYQNIPDESEYICSFDETRGIVIGVTRKSDAGYSQ